MSAEPSGLSGSVMVRGPAVVMFGFEARPTRAWSALRPIEATTEDQVVELLRQRAISVLVLGPTLGPSESHRVLSRCFAEFPSSDCRWIVLGVGQHAWRFQDWLDDDSIFYLSCGSLGPAELHALVAAAVEARTPGTRQAYWTAPEALAEFLDRASMQTELSALGDLIVETAVSLAGAERGQFFVNQRAHVLGPINRLSADRHVGAATGIVGYVLRTGMRIVTPHAAEDPRYDAEVDNPGGDGNSRLVAEPIRGAAREVLGVVTIVRSGERPSFSDCELGTLSQVAECATPAIASLVQKRVLQQSSSGGTVSEPSADQIFREEALRSQIEGTPREGRLLSTFPQWLRRLPWVLLVLFVVMVALAAVINVPEYASGSGIIRPRSEVTIMAPVAGQIEWLDVVVGQPVDAGALIGRLRRAADSKAEPLWAPAAGVMMSHAHAGEWVAADEPVAHIVDDRAGFELVAFVPASYAPQLGPGMPVVFRLHGYSDRPQWARVYDVGSVLTTRNEVARWAGDFVPVSGPVVVVRSRLSDAPALTTGRRLVYRRMMTGDADIRLSSHSVLSRIVRGLRGEAQP